MNISIGRVLSRHYYTQIGEFVASKIDPTYDRLDQIAGDYLAWLASTIEKARGKRV